jgi:hypothetical protein
MKTIRRMFKRWWLPSLLLVAATFSFGIVVPGLFTPDSIERADQTIIPRSPTPEPTLPLPSGQATTIPVAGQATAIPGAGASQTAQPQSSRSISVNCTYTWHYWRSQPDAWMTEFIQIGRLEFSKTEALEIMALETEELDASVLREFFATILNVLRGTESTAIDATLVSASSWIERNPLGVALSDDARQEGTVLLEEMSNFNNGVTGPGHCTDELFTPTPIPTATATPTRTPTRRPTGTDSVPTDTREPREEEPTDEPPTSEPPTEPAPPTEPPPPTDPPPTKPPPDTPTPAPPPTDVPPPTSAPA